MCAFAASACDGIDRAVMGACRASAAPCAAWPYSHHPCTPPAPHKLQLSTRRWFLCRGCSLFTIGVFTLLTNIFTATFSIP